MDLTYTDEQELFRSSVREFCRDQVPAARLAEIADGDGYDADLWKQACSLGLGGITVPEEHGGSGMTFVEEHIAAEELGRAVFPGPYLGSAVLAPPALAAAPDLLEQVATGARIATLAWAGRDGRFEPDAAGPEARPDGDDWVLEGEARYVSDLAAADLLVVAAGTQDGIAVFSADAAAAEVEVLPTVDLTRRLGIVRFAGTPARLLVEADRAAGVLEEIRTRGLAALAAEAAGIAVAVTELATEHAQSREQFGRPIGVFQAVSHQIAESFRDAENARSLAIWAAAAIAAEREEAPIAAATARSFAAEAAIRACERTIQVHGGIGFTWEHVLHRYYKRALWIESWLGTGIELRARIAASLLDA